MTLQQCVQVCMVLIVAQVACATTRGSDLAEQFRQAAPQGWAVIDKVTRQLSGTVVDEQVEKVTNRPARTLRVSYDATYSADRSLIRYQFDGPEQGESLLGVNEHYAFQLTRPSGNSPWMIGFAGANRREILDRIPYRFDALLVSVRPWGASLDEIVGDPTFQIDEAKTIDRGGRSLVEITFHAMPPDTNLLWKIVGGRMTFDPAQHWCLQTYDFALELRGRKTSPWTRSMSGTIEYSGEIDGVPLPKHYRRKFSSSAGNTTVGTCVYSNLLRSETTPASFNLTAFGLPEIALQSTGSASRLMVTSEIKEFKPNAIGAKIIFAVCATNQGRDPVTLLGAFDTCSSQGCFTTRGLPTTIPPGDCSDFTVEVGVGDSFSPVIQHLIYTNLPNQRELKICLDTADAPQTKGIGVSVRQEGEDVIVNSALPDSQAWVTKSVNPGDRLVAVAQENHPPISATGLSMDEVVGMIRGPKGSTVRLTIVPVNKNDSEARIVSLTRGELKTTTRWGDGTRLEAGTEAPDIQMLTLSDKKLEQLSDYAGKIIVIDFWATWCGPCHKVMADLQECATRHPGWKDKVVIIAVSMDEDQEVARSYLKEKGWDTTHNVWVDVNTIKAWHIASIPATHVIDPQGKIATTDRHEDFETIVNRLLDR